MDHKNAPINVVRYHYLMYTYRSVTLLLLIWDLSTNSPRHLAEFPHSNLRNILALKMNQLLRLDLLHLLRHSDLCNLCNLYNQLRQYNQLCQCNQLRQ